MAFEYRVPEEFLEITRREGIGEMGEVRRLRVKVFTA
jgi:hypothetical protein